MASRLDKNDIELHFGFSQSTNYQKALELCNSFANHITIDKEGILIHKVIVPHTEGYRLKKLYSLVQRWKSTELYIHGQKRRSLNFKDKKWQELEELVAQIEKTLIRGQSNLDVTITSPDKSVLDKVTGEKREVDVSIKYKLGSTNELIAIECRDRHRIQDVTWIEQLATKAHDIGASRMIAVSSSQFSQAAIRKAEAHKIDLRLLHEITEETIKQWTEKILIQKLTPLEFSILSCTFEHEDTLRHDVDTLLQAHPFTTKFISRQDGKKHFSIEEILNSLIENSNIFEQIGLENIAEGKQKIGLDMKVTSFSDKLYVPTTLGLSPISKLFARIIFHFKSTPIFLEQVFQYANHQTTISQIAKGQVTIHGTTYTVLVQPSGQ